MNIKKVKLGLSVRLLNLEAENILQGVKDAMQDFQSEVGNLICISLVDDNSLNPSYRFKEYAFSYEHVQLHVEVVNNPFTKLQMLQNFSFKFSDRMAA
ncbi:MAG: hypothetical protein ACKOAY_12995 [Haliscomenobacter sp.]